MATAPRPHLPGPRRRRQPAPAYRFRASDTVLIIGFSSRCRSPPRPRCMSDAGKIRPDDSALYYRAFSTWPATPATSRRCAGRSKIAPRGRPPPPTASPRNRRAAAAGKGLRAPTPWCQPCWPPGESPLPPRPAATEEKRNVGAPGVAHPDPARPVFDQPAWISGAPTTTACRRWTWPARWRSASHVASSRFRSRSGEIDDDGLISMWL